MRCEFKFKGLDDASPTLLRQIWQRRKYFDERRDGLCQRQRYGQQNTNS